MSWSWKFWQPGVIQADETWVVTKLHNFQNGIAVMASDLDIAANWIFTELENVAKYVPTIVGIAQAAGVASVPGVAAAIGVTETALAALNAYKIAHDAGASTVASVTQAYHALTDVKVAYSAVAKAVTTPAQSIAQAPATS